MSNIITKTCVVAMFVVVVFSWAMAPYFAYRENSYAEWVAFCLIGAGFMIFMVIAEIRAIKGKW